MAGSLVPRKKGDGRRREELGGNCTSDGGEGGNCMSLGLSCGEGSLDEMIGDSMVKGAKVGREFLGAIAKCRLFLANHTKVSVLTEIESMS
jgi:hypothetical protein